MTTGTLDRMKADIENIRRATLRALLDQCTPAQQKLFNQMYKSIDDIEDAKIDWAIQQVERTVQKNKALAPIPSSSIKT